MKIIDKLQKLLNHEKSAREIGNIAEAQAFAGKIQQLLTTHNLSISEIEIKTAKKTEIEGKPIVLFEDNANWKICLLGKIAEINGCKVLYMNDICQLIVGRDDDRLIVISLFQHFEKIGQDLAGKFEAETIKPSLYTIQQASLFITEDYLTRSRSIGFDSASYINNNTMRRQESFLLGFAISICERLAETNQGEIENSENSAALIYLGNRQKDAQNWIDKNLNVSKKEKELDSDIDHLAFFKGLSAGNNIALTDKLIEE